MDDQKISGDANTSTKSWLVIRIIGILLTSVFLAGWGYLTFITGVFAWLTGVLGEGLSIVWLLISVTLWGGGLAVLILLILSFKRPKRD